MQLRDFLDPGDAYGIIERNPNTNGRATLVYDADKKNVQFYTAFAEAEADYEKIIRAETRKFRILASGLEERRTRLEIMRKTTFTKDFYTAIVRGRRRDLMKKYPPVIKSRGDTDAAE